MNFLQIARYYKFIKYIVDVFLLKPERRRKNNNMTKKSLRFYHENELIAERR